MSKSETQLVVALERASAVAECSMTQALVVATVIGRDLLARVDYTSERCGRAWTLHRIRKATRDIEKALAAAQGGPIP